MKYTCTAPSGGIPAAVQLTCGAPSIAPSPTSAAVPIYRDDGGGLSTSVTLVDSALVYNVASYAIPAGTACVLDRSPGALRYFVVSAPGANPTASVGPNGIISGSVFIDPSVTMWLGPFRF